MLSSSTGSGDPKFPDMKSTVISETPNSYDVETGSSERKGGQLKRDLGARHINMIAIAGMIGTGLFLSSGNTIAMAGPVGALLAYIFMGFVTAGVSVSQSPEFPPRIPPTIV